MPPRAIARKIIMANLIFVKLVKLIWESVTRGYNLVQSLNDLLWLGLIHWGRVTHICVSKLTIIASDNGLSPGRRQAIIWTSAGILLIGPLGTNFSEILIEIITFSFKKMRLKVSSAKWRPCCLGLNVLRMGHQERIASYDRHGYTSYWPDHKEAALLKSPLTFQSCYPCLM